MENKYSGRSITFETLEKAVSGDYNAMQEVIRLFKPYMATNKYESLRRLFLLYPLYPPVLKISGYNGYNECKEPDIHSETQKGNSGNLTEIHC